MLSETLREMEGIVVNFLVSFSSMLLYLRSLDLEWLVRLSVTGGGRSLPDVGRSNHPTRVVGVVQITHLPRL